MAVLPASRPAFSYAEGVERARAFMALDDERVLPEAHTALLDRGGRTPLAVVLFHGFTNNPAQFSSFAPLLRAQGANVFVPRLPEHGYRDRMSTAIASLTAEALLASANEALDIACGLGERVGVLGISMGATLAAYFAQFRRLGVAVCVTPDVALLQFPYGLSRTVEWLFLHLPNAFLWWDPRVGIAQRPLTAYPRFSTRALAQTLRVGDEVYAAAASRRPLTERMTVVVTRADPAVNNEVTETLCARWSSWNGIAVEYAVLRRLPENHDIVDPRNPLARTDLVYPRLLRALCS